MTFIIKTFNIWGLFIVLKNHIFVLGPVRAIEKQWRDNQCDNAINIRHTRET